VDGVRGQHGETVGQIKVKGQCVTGILIGNRQAVDIISVAVDLQAGEGGRTVYQLAVAQVKAGGIVVDGGYGHGLRTGGEQILNDKAAGTVVQNVAVRLPVTGNGVLDKRLLNGPLECF